MKQTDTLKICFFNPLNIPTYPPLNLTYLASYLRKYSKYKFDIHLVDINCSVDPIRDILDFKPDVLGFTTLSSHLIEICKISSSIRKLDKNILLVCGGVHATIAPQDLLSNGEFDIAVVGEGELTFKELMEIYVEHDRKLSAEVLKNIKGIAYRNGDKIELNGPRELIEDLDTIPHPDRELLYNKYYHNRYYIMRGMNTYGVTTIAGSRGCPYKCIFCCVNFTTFNKVRFHSIGYIADEMEELALRYKAKWLFFTDDTFLINKKIIFDLCEEIIHRRLHERLKWECQVRSNLLLWEDLPLLKLMKRAGCEEIGYGFESGNQRMLTLIKGKGITVDDHQRAIDITNKARIKVFGSFILGTPSETYEELMDTKNFILRNYKKFYRFQVTFLMPYPRTPVYDLCVKRGIISNDYFKELKNDREGKWKEGERVFCDTINPSLLFELRRELDYFSLKKIRLMEKINWLVFNLLHNRSIMKIGIKWVWYRIFSKEKASSF